MVQFHYHCFHPPLPIQLRRNVSSRKFITILIGMVWRSWKIIFYQIGVLQLQRVATCNWVFSQIVPIAIQLLTIFCFLQSHKPAVENLESFSLSWHLFHVSVMFHSKNIIFRNICYCITSACMLYVKASIMNIIILEED